MQAKTIIKPCAGVFLMIETYFPYIYSTISPDEQMDDGINKSFSTSITG